VYQEMHVGLCMLITLRDIGPSKASYTEAEFLCEIQTKVLKVFLLAIHNFALRI
jgi:hypothetical protein